MGKRKKDDSSLAIKAWSFHQKFLQSVKEVYPLAVLSSFSIAISTFSRDISISAQGYAIGAGMCFLYAFVSALLCSLTLSIGRLRGLSLGSAIISYISVGSGIVLLILVANEFAASCMHALNKVIKESWLNAGIQ